MLNILSNTDNNSENVVESVCSICLTISNAFHDKFYVHNNQFYCVIIYKSEITFINIKINCVIR